MRLGGYRGGRACPSDARGLVDVEALRALVDDEVAGLMLTNPNTLGLFEERIEEITDVVHEVGGLVYYDGANLNAILGKCRPGDMGFDIVHINTHKTFATPHGGGGPGPGPVGVVEAPRRRTCRCRASSATTRPARSGSRSTTAVLDRPACTASTATSGCSSAPTRTCSSTARTGSRRSSELAVLNANYLAALLPDEFPLAFPDGRPMHEFVATAEPLKKATGIRAMDVAKRLIDLGYHPLHGVLPARRRRGDDGRAHRDRDEGDARGVRRAPWHGRWPRPASEPDLLHEAPVSTPVRRLDEARAARHLKLRW